MRCDTYLPVYTNQIAIQKQSEIKEITINLFQTKYINKRNILCFPLQEKLYIYMAWHGMAHTTNSNKTTKRE